MFIIRNYLPSFVDPDSYDIKECECNSSEDIANFINEPLDNLFLWNNKIVFTEDDNSHWRIRAVVISGLDQIPLPKVMRILPKEVKYTIKCNPLSWESLDEEEAKQKFWDLRGKSGVEVIEKEEVPERLLLQYPKR